MPDEQSNTAKKLHPGLKPFAKGHDPRRNLKGRPKAFDFIREIAQSVAEEEIRTKSGDARKRIEEIVRKMADNPRFWPLFVELAYGIAPRSVQVSTPTEPIVITKLAPGEKLKPTDGGGT